MLKLIYPFSRYKQRNGTPMLTYRFGVFITNVPVIGELMHDNASAYQVMIASVQNNQILALW